jgi:hypothetical protein
MVQKMETSRSEVVLELELPSIADRGTSRVVSAEPAMLCYVNPRNDESKRRTGPIIGR